MPSHRECAGDNGLARNDGSNGCKRDERQEQRRRTKPIENVFARGRAVEYQRRLPCIVEDETWKHQYRPGKPDRPRAKLPHVGIKRLRPCNAKEHRAENDETAETVCQQVVQTIAGIDSHEDSWMLCNSPNPQSPDRDKPDKHDWPESSANARGAQRLHREQRQQNRDRSRQDVWLDAGRRDLQTFQR